MINNYKLSQSQTTEALEIALKADIPTMVTSSAGLGKSSIIKQIAESYNLKVIDIRLSQVTQYDLLGFPKEVNGKMRYVPMEDLPLEHDFINPKTGKDELPINPNTGLPYDGFLLFLDELNSADKYTQGAAYKLFLEREVGSYKLHPNCRIFAAGNRIQDKAVVTKLVSPMKSRMTHIEMYLDEGDFLEYVGERVQEGTWNPLVYSFLNFKRTAISNFDPDNADVVTFACPRTWEMVSNLINNGLLDLDPIVYKPIIAGTVGAEASEDFSAFLEVMGELPSIEDIVADPSGAPMPLSIGAKWALGGYLFDKIDKTNDKAIIEYINRIDEADIKVVIYRMMLPHYPQILHNKEVAKDLTVIRKRLKSFPSP